MQGLRNVLTDKRLFLPTMHAAIDLLRIAHGRSITLKSSLKWNQRRSEDHTIDLARRIFLPFPTIPC